MDFSKSYATFFTNTTSFMSIGENVVLNKLTGSLSYQVTTAIKLDVCILYKLSPMSGPSLANVNACGHPFLLVLVVPIAPIPFSIKSHLGEVKNLSHVTTWPLSSNPYG